MKIGVSDLSFVLASIITSLACTWIDGWNKAVMITSQLFGIQIDAIC